MNEPVVSSFDVFICPKCKYEDSCTIELPFPTPSDPNTLYCKSCHNRSPRKGNVHEIAIKKPMQIDDFLSLLEFIKKNKYPIKYISPNIDLRDGGSDIYGIRIDNTTLTIINENRHKCLMTWATEHISQNYKPRNYKQ